MGFLRMNVVFLILGFFIVLVILERALVRRYLKRHESGLTFNQYYLLRIYKPVLVLGAVILYSTLQKAGIFPVMVLLAMGLVTILITYPISKYLYRKRTEEHDERSQLID